MGVPFDQLGPGQVGRLAYQVLGQRGPIPNPRNIRYLSPDAVGMGGNGVALSPLSDSGSAVATGLAGVNLLVSSGTLALSAATYNECRKILKTVNQIAFDIQEVRSVLHDVQNRVQRIDTRMAENNLREAMRHAFKETFTADGIDLTSLYCLAEDLVNFSETLDTPLVFNFGVRLASDVRKELTALLTFLASLRLLLSAEHNLAVVANPSFVVRFAPEEQYFGLPLYEIESLAFHFGRSDLCFGDFAAELRKQINENFTFSSEDDLKKFAELATDRCFGPVWVNRTANYSTRDAEALLDSIGPLEIDFSNVDNIRVVRDASRAWFYNSDASLLFRTSKELQGLKDGYESVFYEHLGGADETGENIEYTYCSVASQPE